MHEKAKNGNRYFLFLLICILFSCNRAETKDQETCKNILDDLELCVLPLTDSTEVVYTKAHGVRDGLSAVRDIRSRQVVYLNTVKNGKEVGVQYFFHPNGKVKFMKEIFHDREVNWKMKFDESGELRQAIYGHDQYDRSEMGARLNYVNGKIDKSSSMGVIKSKENDEVIFEVLYDQKPDSIYFFFLNREYDILWSEKCIDSKISIPELDLADLKPILILTQVFLTIDGKPFQSDGFLKYNEMYPPLLQAPEIPVPKYLSEASFD